MKITKYLQIGFILALLVGCENAVQKVTETTDNSIKNAATSAGTVGKIKYNPLNQVIIKVTSFNKDVMPILKNDCKECHGATPLTGHGVNRFSIDVNSNANTVTNITSNSFINVGIPASSKILKKSIGATSFHFGGIRINQKKYNTLFAWIKAGANNN